MSRLTLPATFALTKCCEDVEPDVELVELRFAWAPVGMLPDWPFGERSRVLVPCGDAKAASRCCVIDLPCGLEGCHEYVLHHYFLVVQKGRQRTTPTTEERIVSREIVCPDPECCYAAVAVQWGPTDATLLNYAELVAGEVPVAMDTSATTLATALSLPAPNRPPSERVTRGFRGRIWGPRDSTMRYVLHFCSAAVEPLQTRFVATNSGVGRLELL